MLAPIALFCFRRPVHLERTLSSLAANHGARGHDLIAFCDGPRSPSDTAAVGKVRALLAEWAGRGAFRSFTVEASDSNRGLRSSILAGVSRVTSQAGAAIVVEDDLETSPWFLPYCDDGLELYAQDDAVASIHGYCYPVAHTLPASYFLRGADCWGWATWRRAWERYEDDAGALLAALRERGLERAFNHGGARDLTGMLASARDGHIDSWAIRWHASAFLAGMHTLYPGRSLVRNIGLDASGTNFSGGANEWLEPDVSGERVPLERLAAREDEAAWQAIGGHFRRSLSLRSRLGRVLRRLGGRA